MLDLRTEKILEYLKTLCPSNGYSVATVGEIITLLADFSEVSTEEIERCLSYLSYAGFINMRFCEGGEFCFSILPKGRAYEKSTAQEIPKEKPNWKSKIVQAVPSFVGGVIGGIIAGVIGKC